MLASWYIGGIAVPLCPSHPDEEIQYLLSDSRPSILLCDSLYEKRMRRLGLSSRVPVQNVDAVRAVPADGWSLQDGLEGDMGALIIYTSGTTGRPKGVLHSHASLGAQVSSLATAWDMSERDTVMHCLPLHHVHGVVNALLCPLFSGGAVRMFPKFSVQSIWQTLANNPNMESGVFMGVPTMYSFLINSFRDLEAEQQEIISRGLQNLRISICGSAACPLPLMERWREISGEYLLERYGMTETGMILGNPLSPSKRKPGTVGKPFPGYQVKLDAEGQVLCKGKQLFQGYWGLQDITTESFDINGWFKTGDIGEYDDEGYIRLLGRASSDVIKVGGFKVSALEIESALLGHDLVEECVVFGIPDLDYGEKIVGIIKKSGDEITKTVLDEWLTSKLAPYQMPSYYLLVDHIPRNAMGKVNKKELRRTLGPDIDILNK